MSLPPRKTSDEAIMSFSLQAQLTMTREEFAAAMGISEATLERIVRLGLLEPGDLSAASAERFRRMLRLHGDLGVDLVGASIIVDLLERLDRLEAELSRRG